MEADVAAVQEAQLAFDADETDLVACAESHVQGADTSLEVEVLHTAFQDIPDQGGILVDRNAD